MQRMAKAFEDQPLPVREPLEEPGGQRRTPVAARPDQRPCADDHEPALLQPVDGLVGRAQDVTVEMAEDEADLIMADESAHFGAQCLERAHVSRRLPKTGARARRGATGSAS